MVELAFDEGAAGALKQARHGMEGSRDVAALSLALDMGDISDMDGGMAGRQKLLDCLYAEYPGVSGEIWNTTRAALQRLLETKTSPEPVRMWIGNGNPAELCGLYFVCHLLKDTVLPLSVVRIPEQIETESSIVSYRNTGEIHPEAFRQYTKFEEPISELRQTVFANMWTGLVRENAPLRAVVNGSLMGVPEDFYDFAIRAAMPEGTFRIAHLIGRTLNQTPGVGDQWLYLRIKAMLQSGELFMVFPADDHHYSSVVGRGKEACV